MVAGSEQHILWAAGGGGACGIRALPKSVRVVRDETVHLEVERDARAGTDTDMAEPRRASHPRDSRAPELNDGCA